MRILAFFILFFSFGTATASSLEYSEAKRLANHDEASLSVLQKTVLIKSQSSPAAQAFSTCFQGDSSSEKSPFVVVMKLDASGSVQKTWREGDSSAAICFEKMMGHASLFTPPRAPFYTSIEMSFKR